MIAHVAELRGSAEQLDDFMARITRDISPVLGTREGFIQSLALIDRTEGRGLLITVWKDRAAVDASTEQWRRDGATQGVSASVGLERVAHWYEVAAVAHPKADR